AKRAVSEADQLRAAIRRDVDEEPALHLALSSILHQGQRRGRRCRAAAGGAIHRLAPQRLAVHVVSEGAAVALVEWLDEDDRVRVTGRFRPDVETRKSGAARLFYERGLRRRGEALGETDGESAGIARVQIQVADIRPEVLPRDLVCAGKESARLLPRAHIRL